MLLPVLPELQLPQGCQKGLQVREASCGKAEPCHQADRRSKENSWLGALSSLRDPDPDLFLPGLYSAPPLCPVPYASLSTETLRDDLD